MASVFEKQRRQAIITKALLLGYEFKWGVFGPKACYMLMPYGMYYATLSGCGSATIPMPVAFPAVWLAAQKALELSGVPYETKSSGDFGVGSGARYRLRGRQRLRGSSKRIP